MKTLELFAGAGGMALGFGSEGFEHAALVEIDEKACNTLRAAFGEKHVVQGDLSTMDFSPWKGVDVLTGGPPCQPYSNAGKKGGRRDARDGFPWFIRAIKETDPRYFLAENVAGFAQKRHVDYREEILEEMQSSNMAAAASAMPAKGTLVASSAKQLMAQLKAKKAAAKSSGEKLPAEPEKVS